ncbi:hypothetical protein [Paraburkholderia oxyphila]|uniref:hypothetical protein n=1 Tax=Paraburkholderia oxyphila TaxID=614212 RepID=UPI0012EE4D32|nr:hypothetical protein [Paraburkholderia oxyphila]
MRAIAILVTAIALGYMFFTHRADSQAYSCVRSTSPDGRYIAEECTLDWDRGDNPKYVGRLYDAASGKLLARRTLHTPVPGITWVNQYLLFSSGGDDEDMVALPLSLYDRFNAAYWRLTRW